MKSLVVKRSIVVSGHNTSVSLEDSFSNALKEIAKARNVTVRELVAALDSERQRVASRQARISDGGGWSKMSDEPLARAMKLATAGDGQK